nr:hypothetical protein [Tepidiphilus baoligensis]
MRCDMVLVEELQQGQAGRRVLTGQQQRGRVERLRQGAGQAEVGAGVQGELGFDQQSALQLVPELRGRRAIGDECVEPAQHEFAQQAG